MRSKNPPASIAPRSTDTNHDSPPKRPRHRTSAERFVQVWSAARSCAEVAATLNMTPHAASARASFYRSHGVRLKRMTLGKPPLNAARLNSLLT